MKYSIIIPTYNHLEDCLIPCVESIKKYTVLDPKEIEIVIVANGCTDGTRDYITKLNEPFKILWFKDPLGYTRATNEGLNIATGEHVIFLNNDTILLEQTPNQWLDLLVKPFLSDPRMGVSGPLKLVSEEAGRNFIVFFCAMTSRKVLNAIGNLDEIFSPGNCEDVDFCVRAENAGFKTVAIEFDKSWAEPDRIVGGFPIFHKGEVTVFGVDKWNETFERNKRILAQRYNPGYFQFKYGNSYERAVFADGDQVFPREKARYEWAAKNLYGKKILELGCSSGYGRQFFPEDIEYTGIDYDQTILEFAKKNFPNGNYKQMNLETDKIEGYWDTIIAFEVLEHLSNGKELAQELKLHCGVLLCTTPFDEVPGFWGPHHKIHHITEKDFPGFQYNYMDEQGLIHDKPVNGMNLMLMKSTSISEPKTFRQYTGKDVTVAVSTKNRTHSTLPLLIQSIINQTEHPAAIIIYDDNDIKEDLREDPVYKNLFALLLKQNINWTINHSAGKGQVLNHQRALSDVKTDLIWRLDDDHMPEQNVLYKLLTTLNMSDNIGAVGGLILDPKGTLESSTLASNKIEDIFFGLNQQWFNNTSTTSVDHLYSSFLFKKEAAKHGYCMELSPVGHREETIFTYEMKRNGWALFVIPGAITWHLNNPSGGIRSYNNQQYYKHDEDIFKKYLDQWNVVADKPLLVVLDSGLGDHYAFLNVLKEIKSKYPYRKIIIAPSYLEPFGEEERKDITLISIHEARVTFGDDIVNSFNVYRLINDYQMHEQKLHIVDAYKKLYLEVA